MLVTAGRRTYCRAKGRHLLAITDTADVLFPAQEANKRGFGMGSDGEHPGLFLHPILAFGATDGNIVGLVDTQGRVSTAKTATTRRVKTHKKRTADNKESHLWLQGAEMAADCLTEADMITMVCGREGDIFHLFANRPANVHLLVRSNQPRTLMEGGLLPVHCAADEEGHYTLMSCQHALVSGRAAGHNAAAILMGRPTVAYGQQRHVTGLDLGPSWVPPGSLGGGGSHERVGSRGGPYGGGVQGPEGICESYSDLSAQGRSGRGIRGRQSRTAVGPVGQGRSLPESGEGLGKSTSARLWRVLRNAGA
ncbi:MAG: hypothetical protein EXR07_18020 [Acetobacteraceae bacterium]|nr:hypothetical protein [Acetobacteraceae bacterium]